MSRRKCALLSLVVILLGTLALASPDGPCSKFQQPQVALSGGTDQQTVGPQQVQMRLLIAEVAEGKMEARGIKFPPDSSVAYGKVDNADEFRGYLRALQHEGHAKIIAAPTLVTFSGRPASMVVGGEFPIVVPGQQGTFTVEFREYGTRIDCVPTVLDRNRIRLECRPELSSLDYANGVMMQGFIIPGIVQRRIETSIEMRSGETYVLGGLYSHTKGSKSHECRDLESAWLTRATAGACLSALNPYAPCIPDLRLITIAIALAQEGQDANELVVVVTADLIEPMKPGQRRAGAAAKNSAFAHPEIVASPSDSELFQAGAEMDVDQPHAPAILLTPADKIYSDRPRVRLSEARVSTSPSQRILFGVAANSDCGLAGNIAVHELEEIGSACRDNCCEKSDRCLPGAASCCRQTVHIQKLDADECDDEDDEDDEDDDDAVESFISQVLQSQMQYLEGMMRARLHHEKELMEAKVAAESALVKQKAEHVEGMMKLRVEHMAEILVMQESIWDSERKAMADRHRDAIDHERELAELRAKHVEELQSQRIAALESEVNRLRSQAVSGEPERVAHSSDDLGRQSRATRRPVLVELPIHVEELASGRVRYSPIPPKPTDQFTSTEPRDAFERVELTTPPIATTRPTPTEIERLRHEVARLHALIEDLICVAPEAPPSPKPQSLDDDDD